MRFSDWYFSFINNSFSYPFVNSSKALGLLFFTFATRALLMLRVIELIMCIKVVRCNSWVMIAPFQICHQLKYTLTSTHIHILYLTRHKAFNNNNHNNNAIKIRRYDQFEIIYSCLWKSEYSIIKWKHRAKWKTRRSRRRGWKGKKWMIKSNMTASIQLLLLKKLNKKLRL